MGLYTAGGDLESAETAEIAEIKTLRVCGGDLIGNRCGGRGLRATPPDSAQRAPPVRIRPPMI